MPSGGRIKRSGGPLRIGGNSVGGDWFKGVIDEVRIYRRALSGKEILRDMRRRVSRPRATAPAPATPAPPTGPGPFSFGIVSTRGVEHIDDVRRLGGAHHAHPLRDRHADLEHARVRRPRRPPGRRGHPAGRLQRPDRDRRGGPRAGRVGARVRARRHLLERARRRRLRRALHRVRQRDQLRAPGHGRPGRRVRAAGQGGDRRHQGRQPARRPPGAGRRRQHQPEPLGARHARRGAEPRQPGRRLDRPPLRAAVAVGAAHRPPDLPDRRRRLARRCRSS